MQSLEDKVCDVIAKQLKKPRESVQLSAHIRDDLEADSLDMAEVVMSLEEDVGIELSLKEVRVDTVQDVVEYIRSALAAEKKEVAAPASPAAGE